MKIKLSILFLFFSFYPFAQDIQYARKIVKKLCAKKLSGRGYVNQGEKKAATFIASEFKKIGLQKLNPNYKQNFNVSVNSLFGKMLVKLDNHKLKPGKEYLANPGCPSIKGTFEIFYISEAILHTKNGLTQLPTTISEKFIAILPSTSTLSSEEKNIRAQNIAILKSETIKTKGLLIFTNKKLTWRGATKQSSKPILTIQGHLNKKPSTIKINIESKFYPKYTTQNVIGYIKGSKHPDSLLVFTAHYDHLGKMGAKTYFLGANDNASGVAMLLQLAKKYTNQKPTYSMFFIVFGGEEIGLLGSKYYTENPIFPLQNIKFLINFDLAGTGSEGIQVVNGSVYKKQFEKLVAINKKQNYLKQVKIRGTACNSDHCLFYRKEVPSFFIYTLGGIKAYHDIYDIPKTLPLTAFENYYKLITAFIAKI